MLTFLANARDGSAISTATCGTCCCESAAIRAGETNKIAINYINWAAPIGGRGLAGLPSYSWTKITPTAVASLANQPPTNINYSAIMAVNTALTSSVATSAVDPEAQPLTFAYLPLYGPKNGTLVFSPAGTYTYTPTNGYVGYDTFYFTTSDSVNLPIVNKVTITVNAVLPIPALPIPATIPILWIDPQRVSVNAMTNVVQMAITASPAAVVGDVWRLQLVQNALDCEGYAFSHQSCYDFVIGSC